jgi:glycerol-3-phosphate dehydrogenase subunit B
MVDVAPLGHPFNVSSIELARHMDHQDGMSEFTTQIAKEVKRTGATRVVTPPVLGLKKPRSNASALVNELGIGVAELLSFPPSVPGCRLQNAIEDAFVSAGGKIMPGFEASASTVDSGPIDSVMAKGPRRNVKIHTKSVILASGKFVGGGLRADENGVHETALSLMTVTDEYYPASDIRPAHYSSRFAIDPDGHPLFSCGVPVDYDMRPIDSDGHARCGNLFAAGSVLAGYDYLSEKSGLGVALVTGYAAGLNAARLVAGGE